MHQSVNDAKAFIYDIQPNKAQKITKNIQFQPKTKNDSPRYFHNSAAPTSLKINIIGSSPDSSVYDS